VSYSYSTFPIIKYGHADEAILYQASRAKQAIGIPEPSPNPNLLTTSFLG
jgi:hypothetical protein